MSAEDFEEKRKIFKDIHAEYETTKVVTEDMKKNLDATMVCFSPCACS